MSSIVLEEDLQELFYDLHSAHIFRDGKTISDAILLYPPKEIMAKYRASRSEVDFDLKVFFDENFQIAAEFLCDFFADKKSSVEKHIERLWSTLTRKPSDSPALSSKIALPHPYVVPGGRFDEIYYWDSYFTMLGLKIAGKFDLIKSMVDNFAWMIDTYGFIPNGNRTYYLGRSQPPFYSSMVQLLAEIEGDIIYMKYLPSLVKEYEFWMSSKNKISVGEAQRRAYRDDQNRFLNRYFDDIQQPRTEMYSDDVEVIKSNGSRGQGLITDIRAACESGWDFSSRWLADPQDLSTIMTTEILPVDLNCLLFHLESTIAKSYQLQGDVESYKCYHFLAEERKNNINSNFWNAEKGYYFDRNISNNELSTVTALSGIFPLYFGIASEEQAKLASEYLTEHLLKDGGLVSTDLCTGQQWDSPNGWAPLQYIAVIGLLNFGIDQLAFDIADRWLSLCEKVFKSTGRMMEKYNVINIHLESGGGEYPVQDGFGWTNGVYLALKTLSR